MRNIGKISETVLDRSVIKPIKQNKVGILGASKGLDCAFLDKIGVATGYVAYKDSCCCTHAIIQACNNLRAQGVIPTAVSLSISMPDSFREIKLKELMKQACDTASNLGIKIIGGHTEYVNGLINPIVSVTALGDETIAFDTAVTKDGLDIVITKWMGLSGTSVIAKEMRDILVTKLPAYYVDEAAKLDMFIDISKESEITINTPGTIAMHDVAGGGIFTAIWEICKALDCGCRIELKKIPVLQETIEVCEFYDINPYNLRGDGSLIVITKDGEGLVSKLKSSEINATIIGKTTEGVDRIVVRDDEERFLERGRGDELIKVIVDGEE